MHNLQINLISRESGDLIGSTTREMRIIPSTGDIICMDWPDVENHYIVDDVVHRIDDYPARTVIIVYKRF